MATAADGGLGKLADFVDLCCSYGVNAALMKHDLELSDLYDHYRSDYVADPSPGLASVLEGHYHADVFLARPATAVDDAGVDDVLYGLAELGSASWR